jgi:hypothetical protein
LVNLAKVSQTHSNLYSPREKSPLGHPETWPNTLRAFVVFITTLPHPAAVLWGDELIILYNAAWGKEAAKGAAKQGAAQREILAEEALTTIRTTMMGSTRQSLQAQLFLNSESQGGVTYQALLSPLMDRDDKVGSGVVIQLFQMSQGQERKKSEQNDISHEAQQALSGHGSGGINGKGSSKVFENLPLDENPFFQRFAAMLPTGMAILNHKA